MNAPTFLLVLCAILLVLPSHTHADSPPNYVYIISPQSGARVGGYTDTIPLRFSVYDEGRTHVSTRLIFAGASGNTTFILNEITHIYMMIPRLAVYQTGFLWTQFSHTSVDIPYGVYDLIIEREYTDGIEYSKRTDIGVTPAAPRAETTNMGVIETPAINPRCRHYKVMSENRVLCVGGTHATVLDLDTGADLGPQITFPLRDYYEVATLVYPFIFAEKMGVAIYTYEVIDGPTISIVYRPTLSTNLYAALGSAAVYSISPLFIQIRENDTWVISVPQGMRTVRVNTTAQTVVPISPVYLVDSSTGPEYDYLVGVRVDGLFRHPTDDSVVLVASTAYRMIQAIKIDGSGVAYSSTPRSLHTYVTSFSTNSLGIFVLYTKQYFDFPTAGPPSGYHYTEIGIMRINWDLTVYGMREYARLNHERGQWFGQLFSVYAPPDATRVIVVTELGHIVEYDNELRMLVGGYPLSLITQFTYVVPSFNDSVIYVIGNVGGGPEHQINKLVRVPIFPEPAVVAPVSGVTVDGDTGVITYELYSDPLDGSVTLSFDQIEGDGVPTYAVQAPNDPFVNTTIGDLLSDSIVLSSQSLQGSHGLALQDLYDVVNTSAIINGTYTITLRYTDDVTAIAYVYVIGNVTIIQTTSEPSQGCSSHGVRVNGKCTCDDDYFGPICSSTLEECSTTHCDPGYHCSSTIMGVFTCEPDDVIECGCVGAALCIANEGCTCLTDGDFGPLCQYTQAQCSFFYCGNVAACSTTVAGVFSCTTCPQNCSSHGACVAGACVCTGGYSGDACEIPSPCPNGCSGGMCESEGCTCGDAFGPMCMHTQSRCSALYCEPTEVCEMTLNGVIDCTETGIPNRCGPDGMCAMRGMCVDGVGCTCEPGNFGIYCNQNATTCSIASCDGDRCGTTESGLVECLPRLVDGYEVGDCAHLYGVSCDQTSAQCRASSCQGHGSCLVGTTRCACDASWFGPGCAMNQTLCTSTYCSDGHICANATSAGTVWCVTVPTTIVDDPIPSDDPPRVVIDENLSTIETLEEFATSPKGIGFFAAVCVCVVGLVLLWWWARTRGSSRY